MDLKKDLIKNGYCVFKEIVSKKEIETLRNRSEILLNQENDATLKPTLFLKEEGLSNVVFSDVFLNVLKQLSPTYQYFLPNFTVRRGLYIGWHTDDEFVEPDEEEMPGVLQCNIYLQDNCISYGGGIDILTGTHRHSQAMKKSLISIQEKENISFPFDTTDTKAGDLLIFDYRVIHRSTIPRIGPREDSRLAIQWTVCRSLERAQMFINYLIKRQKQKLHLSDFTDNRALAYFFDAINVNYPISFMPQAIEVIKQNQIIFPSLTSVELSQ